MSTSLAPDLLSQTWARPLSRRSKNLRVVAPPLKAPLKSAAGAFNAAQSGSDAEDFHDTAAGQDVGKTARASKVVYRVAPKKPTFKWIRGDLIGKGSYGKVYMALNATTGEIIAVKQVELPQPNERKRSHQYEVVEALKFESATLKDLNHPNIVSYLGIEESPEHLSIFLEYVPGGSIGQCLRNDGHGFRESVTKFFTGQILEGLQYLHDRGILHRDLKADNILLEPSGVCKISDFGISKKAGNMSRARAFTGMKGTVFWMAPEVVDSNANGYDMKVDIWSLGCVVLEMWSGVRPWAGEQIFPVMLKLCNKKYPPVPPDVELSASAEHFRSECFHADPSLRPSASLLRKHPYLELPPNYTFRFLDMSSTTEHFRTSVSSRKSQRVVPRSRISTPPVPPLPPAHELPPLPPIPSAPADELTESTAKPSIRPALTNLTIPGITTSASEKTERAKRLSPPLVFIAPPSTTSGELSAAKSATSATPADSTDEYKPTRRKRFFRVCNPDDISFSPHTSLFNYIPPPLPAIKADIPSTTSSPHSQPLSGSRTSPIGSASSLLSSSSSRAPSIESLSSSRNSTSASSVSTTPPRFRRLPKPLSSVSMRKPDVGGAFAPPSARKIPRKASLPLDTPLTDNSDSPTKTHRRIPSTSASSFNGPEWESRPYVEDVVEHLEEFFPNHILDQAVESPQPVLATDDSSRRRKTKSIRRLAREQYDRRTSDALRRNTMLWDSRLEELKT